jgi:hypothetical protein
MPEESPPREAVHRICPLPIVHKVLFLEVRHSI